MQDGNPPVLKRFKFLANKLTALTILIKRQRLKSATALCIVQGYLIRYIAEVKQTQSAAHDALVFWATRRSSYKLLTPLAEDLLSADCLCLTGLC